MGHSSLWFIFAKYLKWYETYIWNSWCCPVYTIMQGYFLLLWRLLCIRHLCRVDGLGGFCFLSWRVWKVECRREKFVEMTTAITSCMLTLKSRGQILSAYQQCKVGPHFWFQLWIRYRKQKRDPLHTNRPSLQLVAEAKALAPYSKASSQLIGSSISLLGCNQLQV